MAEYINRDAVHDLVRSLTKYAWASPVRNEQRVTVDADDVQFGVDKIPSADVAPVRHGRWLYVDTDTEQFFLCNRCKKKEYWESDYCPSCGAIMNLEGAKNGKS